MAALEDTWRDNLVAHIKRRAAGVYIAKQTALAMVYPGTPDLYLSGAKGDLHLELKLMRPSRWERFVAGSSSIQACLVHKIEPAQIAWLHAASKRFAQGALSGCAQRSAAVVVLIPNNTVTRLAGGVWIDASAVRDVDVLTRSRVQYLDRVDLISKIIATVKDMEHTNETQ